MTFIIRNVIISLNLLRYLWLAYSLISVFIVLLFINNLIYSDIDKTSDKLFIDDEWVITINDKVYTDVNLNNFKINSLQSGDTISMSRTLPNEWDYAEPALYFFVRHSTLDISIDNVPANSYRYFMTQNFIPFIIGAFLLVFGFFVVLITIFAITLSKKYISIFLLAIFR